MSFDIVLTERVALVLTRVILTAAVGDDRDALGQRRVVERHVRSDQRVSRCGAGDAVNPQRRAADVVAPLLERRHVWLAGKRRDHFLDLVVAPSLAGGLARLEPRLPSSDVIAQVRPDGLRAFEREIEVVLFAADSVGVADDQQLSGRVLLIHREFPSSRSA